MGVCKSRIPAGADAGAGTLRKNSQSRNGSRSSNWVQTTAAGWDSAKAEPEWGQFDSLYILLFSRGGCLILSVYEWKIAFLNSWKCLSPKGIMGKQKSMDFIWRLSILLWACEGCLILSIYFRKLAFLKPSKCFIPSRDSRKGEAKWNLFYVFSFYCGLEKGVWHFQYTAENLPFTILKLFYPLEGLYESRTQIGSIK